jgi:hypothetical protein
MWLLLRVTVTGGVTHARVRTQPADHLSTPSAWATLTLSIGASSAKSTEYEPPCGWAAVARTASPRECHSENERGSSSVFPREDNPLCSHTCSRNASPPDATRRRARAQACIQCGLERHAHPHSTVCLHDGVDSTRLVLNPRNQRAV